MIEQDTIKLLRECDAGVKMGIASIDDVIGSVQATPLKQMLTKSKDEHEKLERELQSLLSEYHDEGKEPSTMAKCMSWIKTNAKLAVDASDESIAGLMTDGCNMGVKSLNRYLNQYKAADEKSKNAAKQLIGLEQGLTTGLQAYL